MSCFLRYCDGGRRGFVQCNPILQPLGIIEDGAESVEFAVVSNVISVPVNKREALQSVGIHSYLYDK